MAYSVSLVKLKGGVNASMSIARGTAGCRLHVWKRFKPVIIHLFVLVESQLQQVPRTMLS